jgi:CRISPR-associated protein Cas2
MRSYFILSYDVSDPARWRRVYRIARDYGDALQYSVFLCELGDRDKAMLEGRMREAISKDDDQVLLIRLRSAEDIAGIVESMGRPIEIVDRKLLIY